ncbi:unnamed protein product [Protopolystoma xenopodis]|uniref:Uncharacterized protein n=1 Tax=Protopolystoma xenopodis TaxID=117903 RepID=A0A448WQD3_9PLAT|nr:unnamed protein product [Protopolystoma xenopodis]
MPFCASLTDVLCTYFLFYASHTQHSTRFSEALRVLHLFTWLCAFFLIASFASNLIPSYILAHDYEVPPQNPDELLEARKKGVPYEWFYLMNGTTVKSVKVSTSCLGLSFGAPRVAITDFEGP